jgi:uncharacterized protein (TIGR02246 family)
MDQPSKLPGLEAMPPEDQKAIGATLSALLGGFSKRDAAMLEAVYSDDADWVNAFGTVRTGRAEIVAHLRGLFADANFDAGKLVAPPESRLRRLSDTVVAVSTHLRITGQGLVGGARSTCATTTRCTSSRGSPTAAGSWSPTCTWTRAQTRHTLPVRGRRLPRHVADSGA